MNKRRASFLLKVLAVGVVASLAQNAQSQTIVYNNSTTFQDNFTLNNFQAGNEVVLAGTATSDYLTQFKVQFDLINSGASPLAGTPTGTEGMEINFYQNNGAAVSGYNSPGTQLYTTGFFTMSSVGLSAFTEGQTITISPNVVVPQDFTWTVAFQNVPASESAGLSLYHQATGPTVGANFNDAWYNNGTAWTLQVANAGSPPLQFGATASVPEPSTIALGVMGAGALLARRRKN
ncbi:MAG TPA: PEP-CTERM sorting domain-containing protein [Candidatus Saccharimonadales bacterium]|nr:PEP-CTERM sorting domain-containing protein [Candidatus Saccharimonadales bacterium]